MLSIFGFDIIVTTFQDMLDYFNFYWLQKVVEKEKVEELQENLSVF
jgi:hypothetical protein